MRPRLLWSAVRTPLLLVAGFAALATNPILVARLVVFQSAHNPFHVFYCAPPSSHDCFFYTPTPLLSVPNTLKLLLYVIGLVLLLEGWGLIRSRVCRKASFRWDGLIPVTAFLLAIAPWWFLLEVKGPNIRLLPVLLVYAAILWVFMVVNAGLPVVERFVARRRWVKRLLEWTFPVSDVLGFTWHRQRMGAKAGWLRFVPVASYLALLIGLAGTQIDILHGGILAMRMPVTVYDPYRIVPVEGGFWYAETRRFDAGLWHVDAGTQGAQSYLRAADLRTFAVDGGSVYLYDGFDHDVLKVNTRTRKVLWRVPVPPESGLVEVLLKRDRVVMVAGREGYLAVIDTDGRKRAERVFESGVWYPQALPDGRVAFLSPNQPIVRIVSNTLMDDEVIPLPLPEGLFPPKLMEPHGQARGPLGFGMDDRRGMPLIAGTECVDGPQTLYVAMLWGEVFRYDLAARRWLASFRTVPGTRCLAADRWHGLLFVYSYARGLVDILALDSGRHLAYANTSVFGNVLSLVPESRVAILSAHGPGFTSLPKPGALYQFDYGAIAATRMARLDTKGP